jgi:hypothetical protein
MRTRLAVEERFLVGGEFPLALSGEQVTTC